MSLFRSSLRFLFRLYKSRAEEVIFWGRALALALILIVVGFACTGDGGAAVADEPPCAEDCCLPERTVVDGEELFRRGVGVFRYWGFRVYTGALYASISASSRERILGEMKKKLVLCFHRTVSTDQFIERAEDLLIKNPKNDINRLRPLLNRLNGLYVPVTKGDSYAITFVPGSATMRLFYNDRELGYFSDASFALAYFGIWLSDYSVSKRFTSELFGEEK